MKTKKLTVNQVKSFEDQPKIFKQSLEERKKITTHAKELFCSSGIDLYELSNYIQEI